MRTKKHKILKIIIPSKVKYQNEIYEIRFLAKELYIKGYEVSTIDNLIYSIKVNGTHPNANPQTNNFCFPKELASMNFNNKSKIIIENQINIFNLDDCYFRPWDKIKFDKR